MLDDRWKNVVQPAAYDLARDRGWNVFGLTPEQTRIMQDYIRDELTPLTESFYAEHFDGERVVLGQRGAHTFSAVISGLDRVHIALPLPRLFETELEPAVQVRWRAR